MGRNLAILFIALCSSACATNDNQGSFYVDSVRVRNDLLAITGTTESRNYQNIETLNWVAGYIFSQLLKSCDTVYYQAYCIRGKWYKNVIGVIGNEKKEKIVVGAHYDVAGDQPGADDNASGVAGLLELARILSLRPISYTIEFVAYTLEEPPFFGTKKMGSYIHAKTIFEGGQKIKGMLCLDMIGYFDDKKGTQQYPLKGLGVIYGSRGNYITIIQKFGNGKFGRRVKRKLKGQSWIRTKSFKGPVVLPGIDFSDHRNYWGFGFPAVLITNTAFYRNPHYHQKGDVLQSLNIDKMCRVVQAVYLAICGV